LDILVLGIGNVLLTDEGIGVRALKEIERRYAFSDDVELLDGGTAGIELLRHIRNRKHLIIIDAMLFDQEPGTVTRVEGKDVPAAFLTRISPHQLGLSDLLAAAMLTDELPENLVLFGVEPESIDIGLDLTDTVEASLSKLIGAVIDELRTIGCSVKPIDGDFTEKARFWDAA
jgi:hydrogenase maturation protease